MIPEVSREDLLRAMARFDEELRNQQEWGEWEHNRNYEYAIVRAGRRYPVKKIVSMASGLMVQSFSGGNEANGYVQKRCTSDQWSAYYNLEE